MVRRLEVHVHGEPSGWTREEAIIVPLHVEIAEGVGEAGAEGGRYEWREVDYCDIGGLISMSRTCRDDDLKIDFEGVQNWEKDGREVVGGLGTASTSMRRIDQENRRTCGS